MSILTKQEILGRMNAPLNRTVTIPYGDFDIEAQVDLSLAMQFALTEQVFSQMQNNELEINKSRCPLYRKNLFEQIYSWNCTDLNVKMGFVTEDGEQELSVEQAYQLTQSMDIVGRISEVDPTAKRMFERILESIDYRINLEDGLLAANLSNSKLNDFLTEAGAVIKMVDNYINETPYANAIAPENPTT